MEKKKKILLGSTAGLILLLILTRKKMATIVKSMVSDTDKKNFITQVTPTITSIAKQIGVPPLFMLAQVCLESRFGASTLSKNYYNYGGIKAAPGQPFITMKTTECKNGVCKIVNQNFRKFNSVSDGLQGQKIVLTNKYFKPYLNKTSDPLRYAQLLQSGAIKYATSPNYVKNIGNALKEINRLLT